MLDYEFFGSFNPIEPVRVSLASPSSWGRVRNPFAWKHGTVVVLSPIADSRRDDYTARIRHSGSTSGWMVKSCAPYSHFFESGRWQTRRVAREHDKVWGTTYTGIFVFHLSPGIQEFDIQVDSGRNSNIATCFFFPY